MVVGSVRTLLQRIKELESSKETGAKEVFTTLVKRGLTAAKVKEVQALLKEAEEGSPKAPGKASVSAEELAAAQAAQLEAYEDLRDWFNDMATHLRTAFNVREQVVLALTRPRARGAAAEELDDEEELDEEDAAGEDEVDEEDEDAPAAEETAPAKGKAAPAKPKGK